MEHFYHYILHSNVINFVIMIAILYAIIKKVNLGKTFDQSIENVSANINKSDNEKVKAQSLLDDAQNLIDKLPNDIKTLENNSKEKVAIFTDKIAENTQKTIFELEKNIDKVISIEEKKISNLMNEKTSKASVELAKQHITDLLDKNPELHNQFITNSLDELDKVKL